MNRRDVALATVGLQFLCTATLAAFTWYDAMTLPMLFSVAVLLGVARAFNGPALSALAPNLVPKEVLPNDIALSSIAWQTGLLRSEDRPFGKECVRTCRSRWSPSP